MASSRRLFPIALCLALVLGTPVALAAGDSAAPASPGWVAEAQRAIAAREYQASRNDSGLQAPNRAQDLRTYFEPTGIRVEGRTARSDLFTLAVAGVGREAMLAPIPPGVVSSEDERVEIRRPGLLEWYTNSPAGLEQGFELAQRPGGEGPLVIELALFGAGASLRGEGLVFTTRDGRRLSYADLVVADASGRTLSAQLVAPSPGRVRIVIDDAGARYPLAIDPLLTATADTQLESNQASAQLGYSVAGAGDVNGDGYADVIVGASTYDAGEPSEGAAFVFLGSPSGIANGSPANAAARIESNQADAQLGNSVAGAGDVNGDGYDDVIVGAVAYDDGDTDEGAAFVFLGSASGIANGNPATAAAQLESNQEQGQLGQSVAGAGDVNGDGYADVIVSAVAYDAGEHDEGAAFVFLGGASGIASGNPSTAATRLESNRANAYLGFSAASAGDVNGDGYSDVIVSSANYDAGQSEEGAAFVFLGSASGIANGNPATAASQFESDQVNGSLGESVASAGDVNGDGYADVIVGAPGYFGGGAAFVFLGGASGIASGNPSTAATRLESNQANANLGASVASAGDVNGDGYADVIVGADLYDAPTSNAGIAVVFLGGPTGIADGSPATAAAQLESGQGQAILGYGVAGAGDVNGDGYADVIVGAPHFDNGESDEGAAFVYLGGAQGIRSGNPTTASAQLAAGQAGGSLGCSVASAGDVNGDGYSDVIVGAFTYDAGTLNEGAAFIFLGGAAGIASGNALTASAQLESNQLFSVFGGTVAGAGDVNGDGYGDVIVGASSYNSLSGAAFIFLGSASGIASGNPATASAQLLGNQSGAQFGSDVASAGDVNGDGYADVIVSALDYSAGSDAEGAAFIFLGSASGIASGNPSTAATRIESNEEEAHLGASVASAGDVNGDGYADVIVGDDLYDAGGTDRGAALVFLGSANGIANGNPTTAAALLEGDQNSASFGLTVASAGDVNGDGYSDVIVGAPGYDAGQNGEGAAFIFLGSGSGIASGDASTAASQLESNQVDGQLGQSVAAAGDVNGDGFGDVIVGAPMYDAGQTDEGAAFVFLGGATGIASGGPAAAVAQLEGNQTDVRFGFSASSAGDVNGDGFADVIVGAVNYDAGQGYGEGAAFVFYGGGGQTGRSVLARQLRGGGSSTPVQPWGSAAHGDEFQVRMQATHPAGRGRVKLEIEACRSGVDFFGAGCVRRISPSWTDVTATSGGVTLTETVSGLLGAKLYHWHARVLYAPYRVTQAGITSPPYPAHSPWRRLEGQAVEADLRTLRDTDDDGIADAIDTDDDGDGLLDTVETDTGTYVSPSNTGSDPLDADSDDDGLLDGPEVALGTDPNDADQDNDTICDGSGTGGGACTAGPDNCPFISNSGQTNTDALPAGNACQCGDVNNDGIVNTDDVTIASQSLIGATLLATFVQARCNVVGANDGGPTVCDVGDLAILDRFVRGLPVTVQNACQAYFAP